MTAHGGMGVAIVIATAMHTHWLVCIGGLSSSKMNDNDTTVRDLCTRWVPHHWMDAQKLRRVNWCRKMIQRFVGGGSNAVNDIVTVYWVSPQHSLINLLIAGDVTARMPLQEKCNRDIEILILLTASEVQNKIKYRPVCSSSILGAFSRARPLRPIALASPPVCFPMLYQPKGLHGVNRICITGPVDCVPVCLLKSDQWKLYVTFSARGG
ncbi:hypothetical protein EVAR_13487_1 [Eumeta japonica]|uniref:Uncharacterized protein n=1 Tax=Eumeta variegata TaxID=151549 RepID=A0A4C1UZC7_EUMVA|nr:hypothetical protein EVAR_13487_1 [Eumeta japonica]